MSLEAKVKNTKRAGRPCLHPKVRDDIRKLIDTQGIRPGELLGSEKQLCERFNVSRPSIRKALQQLAQEGFIKSVAGKGHYVACPEQTNATQKNLVLCILGSYNPEALCGDSYIGGIVAGLQSSFAQNTTHHMILEVLGSPTRTVENIISPHLNNLAGIILVPMGHLSGEDMLAGTPASLPRIVIGRQVKRGQIPCVYFDHYDGMRRTVQYLLDVGHHKIALLSIDNKISGWPGRQNTKAYQDALSSTGLDANELLFNNIPNLAEANRQLIHQVFNEHPDMTAMVVDIFQDTIILQELARMNIILPDNLSLILIDDSVAAQFHNPPVTVFRAPIFLMGQMGGNMLQELVAGRMPSPRSVKLNGELIVRDSVKPNRQSN